MHTVGYATRSGILPKDSLACLEVAGKIITRRIHARGPQLEARSMAWALSYARKLELGRVRLAVSPEFYDLLATSHHADAEVGRVLENARSILSHGNCEVFVAAPSHTLVAALDEATPSDAWELTPDDAAWVAEHEAVVVYTDGSSATDELIAAWAWYRDVHSFAAGYVDAAGHSLTGERAAVAAALNAHPGPVLILCDCDGVVEGRDTLLAAQNIPDPLSEIVHPAPWRVSHVKGHASCPGNLRADQLARDALAARRGELAGDAELGARHHALVAELKGARGEHSRARRDRDLWMKARRRELLCVHDEVWDDLDKDVRRDLGKDAHLTALHEYTALLVDAGNLEELALLAS